jgi:hypothetical protein
MWQGVSRRITAEREQARKETGNKAEHAVSEGRQCGQLFHPISVATTIDQPLYVTKRVLLTRSPMRLAASDMAVCCGRMASSDAVCSVWQWADFN